MVTRVNVITSHTIEIISQYAYVQSTTVLVHQWQNSTGGGRSTERRVNGSDDMEKGIEGVDEGGTMSGART